MKLHELLQGIEVLEQNADPELELTGSVVQALPPKSLSWLLF